MHTTAITPMKTVNRLFTAALIGCVMFLILTATAMFLYSGGTIQYPHPQHYLFFENPFSDLGRTKAFDGESNRPCMVCFVTAMVFAGIGLGSFFVGFAKSVRQSRPSRICSRGSAGLGLLSALCFVGVACTPWDLYMNLHMQFVLCAFRSLLLASILCVIAIFIEDRRDFRLMLPFLLFIMLLIAYIFVLTRGMSGGPLGDPRIQATGQKIIVYSSIVMVIVQSLQMRSRHRKPTT
jgi:hypothetical protein